jgi:hypothetical protein
VQPLNARRPSALELEILKEMAEGLGRAGERLERAIAGYRELVEQGAGHRPELRAELAAQQEKVLRAREWLVIQREALGMRNHDAVDVHYPLPFGEASPG